MNTFILQGTLVTENGVLPSHELEVKDGIIQSIHPSNAVSLKQDDFLILPGFREQHAHDWCGQIMADSKPVETIAQRFQEAMRQYARQGVTETYVATFGGPLEMLLHYCHAARLWMDDSLNGKSGARLLGINIEGTFLNDECRGAQPAEYCLIPPRDNCIDIIQQLYDTGSVKMANIVPDYGDPSLEAIKYARNLGLLVGSGHTKVSADLLRRAYEECGLQYMVHFTNGPTGQSFKPFEGGGAFEGAMNLPILKELIIDRMHIDTRYVLDIIHRTELRWGIEKIIAVTDALYPSPQEIPQGEFTIGSTVANLDPTGTYLSATSYIQKDGTRKSAPANTLCSSITTMDQVFTNLVNLFTLDIEGHWYHHSPVPLHEALRKASLICSTNQSRLDGSYEKTGSIEVGKRADLIVGILRKANDRYEFELQKTYCNGTCVYDCENS